MLSGFPKTKNVNHKLQAMSRTEFEAFDLDFTAAILQPERHLKTLILYQLTIKEQHYDVLIADIPNSNIALLFSASGYCSLIYFRRVQESCSLLATVS